MKITLTSVLIFSILTVNIISAQPGILPDQIKKVRSSYLTFKIRKQGREKVISSDNLIITTALREPETSPQINDPFKWIITGESNNDKYMFGKDGNLNLTVYTTNIGEILEETWISDNNELVAFRQTFINKTKRSVHLYKLYPLFINGGSAISFGDVKNWRILKQFRQKNDLPLVTAPGNENKSNISDVEAVPAAAKSIERCDPFFMINNNTGRGSNLLIGYQTAYLHLADISVSFNNDLSLKEITANCDFEGVEIPRNGIRQSQWVILAGGNDADRLLNDYTARIREYHNVKKPEKKAPSVYCTWYYRADNYNEEILKMDISHFRKEHMPFDVFLIDECWDVNKWGDFEANESFPSGMKNAAGKIRSAGYIPGIWTAPFLADHESDLVKEHPEWMLRNSKGVLCTFFMNERDHLILDLTYPGVCDYLEEQFRKLSYDWGFKYFKFDFMRSVFIDTDQQFYDRTATSLEAYRKGLEAIRRGTGNDAYISVCGGHYLASLGIADSQRSGSDVKSYWNEKELPKYRQNILRTWMDGLWHVDPDAMMVRLQEKALPDDRRNLTTGLFTDEEAFTNTLNQFIGGNLITFTEDFSSIDHNRSMLYKHVIPSVNSSSRPLDIFNTGIPEIMLTRITPVCKKLDCWNMLSVVNWTNDAKEYELKLNSGITGRLKGELFLIFDFQGQEIISVISKDEGFRSGSVNGHQSKLFKIVPWDGESPLFIGTDLNFACGGLEISDINYESGIISGNIDTPWYVPVTLTFWIPSGEGFESRKITVAPGQRRFFLDY